MATRFCPRGRGRSARVGQRILECGSFQSICLRLCGAPDKTQDTPPPSSPARTVTPHPQPDPFIRQQVEDPLRHRPGIPYQHQEPRPALHDLLGDTNDRACHNRGAAGQGLKNGGREGVGPRGVEVEVGSQVVPGDLLGSFW